MLGPGDMAAWERERLRGMLTGEAETYVGKRLGRHGTAGDGICTRAQAQLGYLGPRMGF